MKTQKRKYIPANTILYKIDNKVPNSKTGIIEAIYKLRNQDYSSSRDILKIKPWKTAVLKMRAREWKEEHWTNTYQKQSWYDNVMKKNVLKNINRGKKIYCPLTKGKSTKNI